MAQKYTLSRRNFAKIHCFKRTLKGVLPRDTLSHNFLINCNTLSHNFCQKRTPCRIIFTVKGHPVERHIPSSQVWEYPPQGWACSQEPFLRDSLRLTTLPVRIPNKKKVRYNLRQQYEKMSEIGLPFICNTAHFCPHNSKGDRS